MGPQVDSVRIEFKRVGELLGVQKNPHTHLVTEVFSVAIEGREDTGVYQLILRHKIPHHEFAHPTFTVPGATLGNGPRGEARTFLRCYHFLKHILADAHPIFITINIIIITLINIDRFTPITSIWGEGKFKSLGKF